VSGARPLARTAHFLTAATLLAVAWLLFIAPPRLSVFSLVGDDAGYYFHLARNDCLGFGYSFDRQTPTNGFNPLVPWLLIPTYRLLGGGLSIDACYRLGVLLGGIAMIVSLWAFARLARAFVDDPAMSTGARDVLVAAAVAFYALFVGTKSYYGMDAPLVLALGTLYLLRVLRSGFLAPGWRAATLDGVLLALIFLARVDSLPWLVAAFGLMAWLALPNRTRSARLVGRAVVCAGLVAPYLISSHARFGTWLPISARIKSAFPHASLGRSLEAIRHTSLHPADQASFLIAFVLAAVLCARVGVRWVAHRGGGGDGELGAGRTAVLALLATYLVLRLGYLFLFSRNDVQGSYVILAHAFNLLVALACIRAWLLGSARPESAREPSATVAAAVLLSLGLVLFAGKAHVTWSRWSRAASGAGVDDATLGQEIAAHTRRDEVIYGGAYGIAGFFADRGWINGDGVINTLAYQEAIRDHRLREYLADHRVDFVVFNRSDARPPIHVVVRSGLFGARDSFVVDPSDIVLQRPTLRAGGGEVILARYRP